MDIVSPTPTSVYRYFDQGGLLLYVGITARGIARQREHNADKEWWPFVARQEVDHFESREAAAKRERHLIRQFHPPFNKQHNPHHDELRQIYLTAVTPGVIGDYLGDAASTLGRLKHKLPLVVAGRSQGTITLAAPSDSIALTRALRWPTAPPLMARTKVGSLVGHALMRDALVLTYSVRKGMPDFSIANAEVKATTKPFKPWIHVVKVAA